MPEKPPAIQQKGTNSPSLPHRLAEVQAQLAAAEADKDTDEAAKLAKEYYQLKLQAKLKDINAESPTGHGDSRDVLLQKAAVGSRCDCKALIGSDWYF